MMGMIPLLALDQVHGEAAGDLFAGGRTEWMEVRFGSVGGDDVVGKMLAVDFDADAIGGLSEFYLGPGKRGRQQEETVELHQGK